MRSDSNSTPRGIGRLSAKYEKGSWQPSVPQYHQNEHGRRGLARDKFELRWSHYVPLVKNSVAKIARRRPTQFEALFASHRLRESVKIRIQPSSIPLPEAIRRQEFFEIFMDFPISELVAKKPPKKLSSTSHLADNWDVFLVRQEFAKICGIVNFAATF